MKKIYTALGTMSGTSMDGIDASIIQSDGETKYKVIVDKYFEYPKDIYKNLTNIRDKIKNFKDLKKFSKEIKNIEKKITLFYGKAVDQVLRKTKMNVDFLGFHGQTIYHNAKEKISKQLGDGKLLSQLTKKTVIFNFRENDLKNGGQGAPLTPIFHKVLKKKINVKNVTFINIGGIINETTILDDGHFHASDIGPGMCFIDKWIRTNSKKKYDVNGNVARSGKVNKKVLEQYFIPNKKSYDISDFDISFVKSLSLEDGAATLIELTVQTLAEELVNSKRVLTSDHRLILCGGGRKNNFLVERMHEHIPMTQLIDNFGIDGDFIESQAFAYLAIRSYLKLPISFPETTGCLKACTGGETIRF